MKFADAAPLPPADVSDFVTYMAPEFQADDDDGSDLPLPDLETLVMPAPESSGRRKSAGKPLRETYAAEPAEADGEAFGDGIDAETAAADLKAATDPASPPRSADSTAEQTGESSGGKRRPRRRRRRGRRGDGASDARPEQPQKDSDEIPKGYAPPATDHQAPDDSGPDTAADGPLSSGASGSETTNQSAASGDEKPAPRKRRRRRRRGPRKKTSAESGPGTSEPDSAPSNGSEE